MAHADTMLYNAARVMVEDPDIRAYLARHDPQALAQAREAIRTCALPPLTVLMIGPYPKTKAGRERAIARAAEFEADPTRVPQKPVDKPIALR